MTRPFPASPILWIMIIYPILHIAFAEEKAPPQAEESDPKALAFIKEAASNVYSPVPEGLETLSFSRSFNTPMGELGTEMYWFKKPDLYGFKLEFIDNDPTIAQIEAAVSANMEFEKIKAAETLGFYLGTFLTRDLNLYTARFMESKPGEVRIRLKAKPESRLAKYINAKDLVFDESGRIKKIKIIDARGKTQTWHLFFKSLKGLKKLIIERIELKTDSSQGAFNTIQRFQYEEIKGFHIVKETQVEFRDFEITLNRKSIGIKVNEPLDDALLQGQ